MDTSKLYIKMCEKAQEIQDLRKVGEGYEQGDFFSESKDTFSVAYFYSSCSEYVDDGYRDSIKQRELHDVWLPRQDQFQEMEMVDFLFGAIGGFLNNDLLLDENTNKLMWYLREFNSSSEKMHLAYLMNFKFNKIWNFEKEECEAQTYQAVRMLALATPLQIADTPLCFIYRVNNRLL